MINFIKKNLQKVSLIVGAIFYFYLKGLKKGKETEKTQNENLTLKNHNAKLQKDNQNLQKTIKIQDDVSNTNDDDIYKLLSTTIKDNNSSGRNKK